MIEDRRFNWQAALGCPPKIVSIDIIRNKTLEKRFEDKKANFVSAGLPSEEVLGYHGTNVDNLHSILSQNLQVN